MAEGPSKFESTDFNPYEPPAPLDGPGDAGPWAGLWRDGAELVVGRGATLPARCLLCNGPAWGPLRSHWLAGPGVWSFPYGLCRDHARRLDRRASRSGCLLLTGLVGTVLGALLLGPARIPAVVVGVLVAVLGMVLSNTGERVAVRSFDARQARIDRVHPDFLADLPPWPGEGRAGPA